MISFIRGKKVEIDPAKLILDVNFDEFRLLFDEIPALI